MLILGILALIVGIYIGLVVGTYRKFKQNGINFIGKAKVVFSLFPLGLVLLHFAWATIALFKNRGFSIFLFKMIIFKYPVVIGMFIELILENAAHNLSENNKVISIKRKSNRKKAIRKKKALDLSRVPQYSAQKKIYDAYKYSIFSMSS